MHTCKAEHMQSRLQLQIVAMSQQAIYRERNFCISSGKQFAISLIDWFYFNGVILTVIVLDALCIGIQASEFATTRTGWYIQIVYELFLAVYIVELFLRLYALRFRFFKSWWNIFSLLLVVVDVTSLIILLIINGVAIFNSQVYLVLKILKIIQALRALRIIITIRFLKNLSVIVLTLLESIPALGAIVITISLVLYIFAVIGRDLYGTVDPGRYGNLAKAVFTLFQLITLDDWFQMYTDINPGQEHVLVFLILFIVIETLIFVNLFVAVIVDNLARAQSNSDFGGLTEQDDEIPTSKVVQKDMHVTKRTPERSDSVGSGQQLLRTNSILSLRDLSNEYLMALSALEIHFTTGHKHQVTLNKLVDVVDLSKS